MSRTVSPGAGKACGMARVCRAWRMARATVCRHHRQAPHGKPPRRPGPIGPRTDAAALVAAIRTVLAGSPFHGEGRRKVWARLGMEGVRTSKRRVLRLMRVHGLLAPSRVGSPRGPRNHDGTIIPASIDTMWGTGLTTVWTVEGQVAVFIAVDRCSAECVGIHAAHRATRFEALEPLRQGVRRHFGSFAKNVARGLAVRHDHGSQYMAHVAPGRLGAPAGPGPGARRPARHDLPRQHQHPRASQGGRRCSAKDAAAQRRSGEALGRPRGGYGSEACVIADAAGRAIAFRLAPGQAHELPQELPLLKALPGVPRALGCRGQPPLQGRIGQRPRGGG
jgi:putative transposase